MAVEDVAIFDAQYTPQILKEQVSNSALAARENVAQIAAVSAICNAAVFQSGANGGSEKQLEERDVVGDATGSSLFIIALSNPFIDGVDNRCRDTSIR